MRFTLAFILSIILAVGVVALGFTFFQIASERNRLYKELETRSGQISDEIFRSGILVSRNFNNHKSAQIADSLTRRYNLKGIMVFFNADSMVCGGLAEKLKDHSVTYVYQSIVADTSTSNFFSDGELNLFQFIRPVNEDDIPSRAMVVYSDAGYIDEVLGSIWLKNFFRWFIQAFIVAVVTFGLIRWGIFNPVNTLLQWARALRTGNSRESLPRPKLRFLIPLHREIESIAREMNEARATAEEEARLRSSGEAIWTPERLKIEIEHILHGKKIIVVSNREPYMHIHDGREIKCIVPASGMITAMEPILKACSGLWIASGTGDADRETVDVNGRVEVPPDNPKYTLKRLWLTKEEETHFYYGFSNEGLWPLCHIAHTRPLFRKDDWDYYKKVNEDFARAVLEETAGEEAPFILIQDFHFALLPDLIRKEKPGAKVGIFWHIPWPNPESFGICPWQKEILKGMLGADLIGFHTQYHCNHFLETVSSALEARVLWENFSVRMAGRTTFVKPFPISIAFTPKDYDNITERPGIRQLLSNHGITADFMGIGVDRIDYTKGIVEKFLAIERFLDKNTSYAGRFTFVQIGAPSRTLIKSYADTVSAVENEAARINAKYRIKNWKPILLLERHHSHSEIAPFYAAANFCMVTSLHDGMNLVAKEFVAARTENDGSLILSRFTGASQELQGAIVVNPYDIERSADAVRQAIEMNTEEQNQRMKQMRMVIVSHNIYSWAASLIRTMAAID